MRYEYINSSDASKNLSSATIRFTYIYEDGDWVLFSLDQLGTYSALLTSEVETVNSKTTIDYIDTIDDTINIIDYRKLNEFLTTVNEYPGLSKMTDDDSLILFAAYITIYKVEEWGVSGSKEAVEAILNRYFDVEKIYHEQSWLYRSWSGWDVDYPIDGIGSIVDDWVNITNFRDIGNGLFMVDATMYFAGYWKTSFLDSIDQWKLKNNGKIIDGDWNSWDGDYDSGDVYRTNTCTVTLKPFTYNGENTWQIVGINGVEVPKVLLFNGYILPCSSIDLLDDEDLLGLTKEELRIAKNEIYARHGYQFDDQALQEYFNEKSWYAALPKLPADVEMEINELELYNIALIRSYEES